MSGSGIEQSIGFAAKQLKHPELMIVGVRLIPVVVIDGMPIVRARLIDMPKAMLRQIQGELTAEGWREVREGIKVKMVRCQDRGKLDASEMLVLCCREQRVPSSRKPRRSGIARLRTLPIAQ
jgi:hypothetical protein